MSGDTERTELSAHTIGGARLVSHAAYVEWLKECAERWYGMAARYPNQRREKKETLDQALRVQRMAEQAEAHPERCGACAAARAREVAS